MNTIFNVKTKQNQIERDKIEKQKQFKKIKKRKTNKKKRIIIDFFSPLFLYIKIKLFLLLAE